MLHRRMIRHHHHHHLLLLHPHLPSLDLQLLAIVLQQMKIIEDTKDNLPAWARKNDDT